MWISSLRRLISSGCSSARQSSGFILSCMPIRSFAISFAPIRYPSDPLWIVFLRGSNEGASAPSPRGPYLTMYHLASPTSFFSCFWQILGWCFVPLIRRVYRYSDNRYLVTFLPPSTPNDIVESVSEAPDEWFPWKRHNNIVRSQSAIQALGFCNDWDYFITCTLDPQKFPDRLALDLFREKVTHLFRRIRSESGSVCRFLLVPELHKNEKGWHMHGLLADFPESCFREFELSEKLPAYLLFKIAKGEKIYDFPRYRDIFGFCDVEPLRSRDHAVSYLCKYVVKGLQSTGLHIDKGKHLYFASKGLNRPQLVDESDQYSSSSVLDDLELDGFRPSFDADIKYAVNGVEQKLGYKVWYEFSPGEAPSELRPSFDRSYSLPSILALCDSESEGGSNRWD